MKSPLLLLVTLLLPALVLAEDLRPLFLPFDVTLGGQKAEMKADNDLFAVVRDPVQADASLVIGKPSAMLIVNAFACNQDGTVEQNAPAAIIFAQDTDRTPLNATMDKKPLAPGTYLMNIVANQATARVVFTVADPTAKIKLPTLESILGFLKKKAP